MKVIFLDVDGVLNSEHWYIKNHTKHPEKCRTDTAIDPRYVRNLKLIVKMTGAKIVLSATCRHTVNNDKTHYLNKIFEKYGLEVYDVTGRFERMRGFEIQDWLDRHRDVTNIVILDDSSDMVHLTKYLVKTKNSSHVKQSDGSYVRDKSLFAWRKEGLNLRKAIEAVLMLNKPYTNIYTMPKGFYRKHF